MTRPLFLIVIVGSVFALGCTLGPNPERPQTAADASPGFVNGPAASSTPAEPDASPWWRRFGDPLTVELVETALENNRDLQVAAARLLEAEAVWGRSAATAWPTVGYQASGTRSKSSFVLPELGRRTIFSTTFSDGITVSYPLDLFGKLKRTRQAAWANLLAQRAAKATVEHSIIAAVVRARVRIATAQASLDITTNLRESWENTLQTIERRYRNGLVGAVDVHLARENLAAVQASEAQVRASLQTARHLLDVLMGRRPGTGSPLPDTLSDLPDLGPVPAGLPAALLDRRPDLLQAEMQFNAATFGVGIALADLYPNLTLTGSAGHSSDTLNTLITSDSVIYNAVAGIVGPIFSGGARRAEVRAARARAEGAAAAYAGNVLTALREVEDALVNDEANRLTVDFARRRLNEAARADRLSRERYIRGVEPFLRVLETERRLRSAEEGLIAARADVWNTRIDLFLALGGDWTPPETAHEDDQSQTDAAADSDEKVSS